MAKIMKDTRQTIDVDTELEKIKKSNEKKQTKEPKKDKKEKAKKDTKKKEVKKTVKVKKQGFFKEVKNEMSKVKWPSKKDMVKYSIATIVFVVFFALFFYAIDLLLALLKEVS